VLAMALALGIASSAVHMASDLHLASDHATQEADSMAAHTDVAAAWAHLPALMALLFPHLSVSASPCSHASWNAHAPTVLFLSSTSATDVSNDFDALPFQHTQSVRVWSNVEEGYETNAQGQDNGGGCSDGDTREPDRSELFRTRQQKLGR
jgi:hypothetical protein